MSLKDKGNTPKSNNSSGPKTPAGKKRSSRNAVKEGFFSRGLILKEEERPEFEARCRGLRKQLKPATEMQHLAFDRVICTVYRVQRALDREMRRLQSDMDLLTPQNGSSEGDVGKGEHLHWYGLGRAELQNATRMLSRLRQAIGTGNFHPKEWEEALTKAFGEPFYKLFSDWSPFDHQAVLMARKLVAGARLFDQPLPDLVQEANTTPEINDAKSQQETMLKMVDLTLQLANDVRRILDRGSAGDSQRVASAEDGRYFATACKDLERAVTWYLELKENGL